MSLSVGELVGTISLQDNFSGPINNVARDVGITGESFRAITGLAGLAASAIVGTTAAIVALGQRGAQVADVQGAFDNLSASVGSTGAAMLGELQSGTLGTISNFDLMSRANAVLSSGLITSANDMGTLAAGAQLLADRTGGDTATAFDTLTSAIASGRTTQLAQLGLLVDTKAAVTEYERANNRLPGSLSAAEEKTAIAAATLAALRGQLNEAGPASADFGDQIDRGKVAVQNFTDGLAVAIATSPVVAAGMDAIARGVQAAFGGNQETMVQTLMGLVNNFAIGLTYVAQVAVTGATVFATAWYAMKTAVLGVITVVAAAATAQVAFVRGVIDLAASIPGASSVIGGMAEGAANLETRMVAVTTSLAAETAEAARGVLGNSELHRSLDALGGGVMLARDAMVEAQGAAAGLRDTVTTVPPPLGDVAAAAAGVTTSMQDMLVSIAESSQTVWQTAQEASAIYTQVQNEITLANSTGIAQRLLEQDIARQAELAELANLLVLYPAIYTEIAAAVNEKYRIMGDAARGFHTDIVVQAGMAGFQTRAELEQTATVALDTYNRMRESGLFTAAQLRAAWEAMEEARRAATGQTGTFTLATMGDMLTGAASMLRAFGVRYKELALAGAIISGISAVQKAWASAPFPANLPAVATVTFATLANVATIARTAPGFAQGTLGTRFEDFGRGTIAELHGREAVVTPRQGASLAGMVEDALHLQDARTVEEIRGLREQMASRDKMLPLLLRDAALLARA